MQLSADQIVEEWMGYCAPNTVKSTPSVDKAWQDETRRRIADIERGRVQGIQLDETLAKARNITGQAASAFND